MDPKEMTDEQIVDSCKENPENFGFLVGRYERFLINFLLKNYKVNRIDAEDLVQESFTKAYLSLQSFDSQKKWKPWLFQITINSLKSFKRKPSIFSVEDFKGFLIAETQNIESVFLDKIKNALNNLTATQQKLLNLYFIENYSVQEISKQQKIPGPVIRARIEQAKRSLVVKYYLETD